MNDPQTTTPDPIETAPDEPAHASDAGQPFLTRLTARWLFWLVLVLVLLADLSSKTWAEANLTYPYIITRSEGRLSPPRAWSPKTAPAPAAQSAPGDSLPRAQRPDDPADKATIPAEDKSSRPASGAEVDGGIIKLVHDFKIGEEGQPFIPGVLHFKYAENFGAAFSIGSDTGHLLTVISIGILGILLFYAVRTPRRAWFTLLALGLIAGGAVGNIHDRIWHKTVDDRAFISGESGPVRNPGYGEPATAVRDFLYWPFDIPLYSTIGLGEGHPPRKWPIFNIADSAIIAGVIGIIIVISFAPSEPRRRRGDEE